MIIYTRFLEERYGTAGIYWDVSQDGIEDPNCEPVLIELLYWPDSNRVMVHREDKIYTAVLMVTDDDAPGNICLRGILELLEFPS